MVTATLKIAGRLICEEGPAFIVAEAACNHMCDLNTALRMVDAAAEAGADAIKFQTYKSERLVDRQVESYWHGPEGNTSQWAYYKRLDRFGREEYQALFLHAQHKGLIAFSTPFDCESASLLNELGMPVFKIASCDLPDVRLLRHVASFRKPVILSTGAAELPEIRAALEILQAHGAQGVALLACTMSYPTPVDQAHLRRIETLRHHFPDCVIGNSDHTEPDPHMMIPAIAVTLGARIVEKHFTLDRTWTGSGHFFSTNPSDLRAMVEGIRLCEKVLGSPEIRVQEVERLARERARRSLVAERAIRKGEVITQQMIGIKRPGTGLSAALIDQVVGKRAKVEIGYDQQIRMEHLLE